MTKAPGTVPGAVGSAVRRAAGPLNVVVWGSGDRVVCVHGSLSWGAFAFRAQRPLADTRSLVLPDRRGYGASAAAGAADFEVDAHDIAELLGEGAHLVGHSYGAVVALLVAAGHPEAVRTLTLVEPAAFEVARGDTAIEELIEALGDVYAAAADLTAADFVLRFLQALGYRRGLDLPDRLRLSPEGTRAATTTMTERPPWDAEIPLDLLATARCPVLVVSGRWDNLAAGEQALGRRAFGAVCDALTQALDARRVVIDGWAHGCQYSGKTFNDALRSFWGGELDMANIAINGLGRIGRAALKILLDTDGLDLVAVNDIADADNLAYLLKYDTVYGRYHRDVRAEDGELVIDGDRLATFAERDPAKLPWGELAVDLVLECTGVFTAAEDLEKHVQAGASFVILSAPTTAETVPTVVHGVNRPHGRPRMISCASCTTNCIAPVIEVAHRRLGVERAVMTTVHAYTAGQQLVDGPSRSFRRGRAGAANLVPTSTGAARATTRTVPELAGRFDGIALRAPIPVGSVADVVFVCGRPTTAAEVNDAFREEAATARYESILGVSEDPLVSADIVGDPRAAIVDLDLTRVVDGTLVKVMAWYDNEWGFTHQMIREAGRILEVSEPRATALPVATPTEAR